MGGAFSKCLDESKIDVLNKHLEKKINKLNNMMKPFDVEEEDDGAFSGSLLKLKSEFYPPKFNNFLDDPQAVGSIFGPPFTSNL